MKPLSESKLLPKHEKKKKKKSVLKKVKNNLNLR